MRAAGSGERPQFVARVLGGAGLLFDPDSDEAIATSILRLLREPQLRADLRARGLARAQAYSWDAGAATMVRVLEEAAQG